MTRKPKVGVFHTGTQHSWQTALAFQETGQLAWYATSIFYKPEEWPYKVERFLPGRLSERLHREMVRRHTPLIDPQLVRVVSHWEWARSVVRRNKFDALDHLFARINVSAAAVEVTRLIKAEPVDVIWSYNTQAEEVFSSLASRGVVKVLDQTIGHPSAMNRLLRQQASKGITVAHRRFSNSWVRMQNREVELADRIVAGSDFCRDTMIENGCDAKKISVLPYGYDDSHAGFATVRKAPRARPVRFIFVGSVEARKGAHLLIEAFRRIPAAVAELTLVGRMLLSEDIAGNLPINIRHVPHVPRTMVGQYLAKADCFVFPSLFEGSALVLYEALGAGLGIIQTTSAGFGVIDGENGILLPESSVQAIYSALCRVIADPGLIEQWSRASIARARDYGWSSYRARCRDFADHLFVSDQETDAVVRSTK